MAARARGGDRLVQHRPDGKIPHSSSSRRQRGFKAMPTLVLQRSGCRFAVKRQRVRTKNHIHGSAAVFNLKVRSEFPATDTGISDRQHQSLGSDSMGERTRRREPLFAGLMIVAAVQAGTPTAPYAWPTDVDRPIAGGRIVETFSFSCSDVVQRSLSARS